LGKKKSGSLIVTRPATRSLRTCFNRQNEQLRLHAAMCRYPKLIPSSAWNEPDRYIHTRGVYRYSVLWRLFGVFEVPSCQEQSVNIRFS